VALIIIAQAIGFAVAMSYHGGKIYEVTDAS